MRFQRIIEQVHFRPWFISAEGHASVAHLLQAALRGETKKLSETSLDDLVNPRPDMTIDAANVAHIHIFGVLGQGLTPIEKTCGNTDYADVIAEIRAAKMGGAQGYVFHVDSPGGMCAGCLEAAQAISSIEMPKAAFTTTQMASAAYALASGCDVIYAADSALVGCIGTILPWVDTSEKWKTDGRSFEPITNDGADLKSVFHGPSLTPEQVEYLTELANDYATQFIDQVKAHRSPDKEVYRGAAYVGTRALAYNLIDGIGGLAEANKYAQGK